MASIETLRKRAHILATIRQFFDERGYLAVETPQLCPQPIPEVHIDLFETRRRIPAMEDGATHPTDARTASEHLFLLPSPEYYLKRLLSAGSGNIYEITHSFRNSEYDGAHHAVEFTMLEYYTVHAAAPDSLEVTTELLRAVGIPTRPVQISMSEAWHTWAGIDLASALERTALVDAIVAAGLPMRVTDTDTWEDLFQRVFLTYVEPELPIDCPVYLTDYPAAIPTLARQSAGTPWAERWELYLGGVEVANCYTEETDPERIRAFRIGQESHIDERLSDSQFLQPPETLPPCSGVALGIDRLVMHCLGAPSIADVMAFVPGFSR